jgi:hypothetical protein
MDFPMRREDAAAWRARWDAVRRFEREELRAMSVEEKWRQFGALFAAAHELGMAEALEEEERTSRERWARLREALREQE